MIDIHNHIIPGVDDGPVDEKSMIDLIKQAAEQNITGIIATPHHLHYRYNNEFEEVANKVAKINENEKVKELGVTVYPGQEIRITDQLLVDLDNGKIKGLNNSKYLLLELPSNQVPSYCQNLIYEIQIRGYVPIIVHPERNKVIAQDINILFGLVNIGALSQITASSLTGELGRKTQKNSMLMIENNLTHFIASDAHNIENRPFGFDKVFSKGKHAYLKDKIESLISNNEMLLNDKKIKISRPIEYKKSKFLSMFSK
ncbi:tyrosine-protein phosphatase [Staphylococcus simulans]|uniref:tyrosine-protein phosphatase n=1 Tax=Staphylococcus simulans TaxID=1286 RepID=UPI00399C4A03